LRKLKKLTTRTCRATSLIFLDCGILHSNTLRDYDILSIVGGSEVTPYSLPWQVGIVSPGYIDPFCGGTLIGPRHVLTAAHCVDEKLQFEVVVGEHEIVYDSSDGTRHKVCGITIHPSYEINTPEDYDFAIIRLKEPVEIGPRAVPACLANSSMAGNTLDNERVTVSGWGALEEDGWGPDALYSADVQVVTNSQCQQAYAPNNVPITDAMLCASNGTYGGIDSCQGDSGGIYI
jgi:trypsin